MSYYKGLWQKTLVWIIIIGIFLTIAAGMSDDNTIWKMWFILPFSFFVVYICGKLNIFNYLLIDDSEPLYLYFWYHL